MSAHSVTATAPGKINVCLRVGPLGDDGYHDVATIYQAVSLLEEVTATESNDFTVSFSGPIDTSHLTVDESQLSNSVQNLMTPHFLCRSTPPDIFTWEHK
jgi:4-diphosphocytidyl-2C-methyl-D-erythritol kinase